MKSLIVILCAVLCTSSFASEVDHAQVYLDFQAAYQSNNAKKVGRWLASDVVLSQALHIAGYGPDSIEVTRDQLLSSMKQMKRRNAAPMAKKNDVTVEPGDESAFCASAATTVETVVSGKRYDEREVRRACFRVMKESWVVISHTIDVYYSEKVGT
jgi:hypothetical protein